MLVRPIFFNVTFHILLVKKMSEHSFCTKSFDRQNASIFVMKLTIFSTASRDMDAINVFDTKR